MQKNSSFIGLFFLHIATDSTHRAAFYSKILQDSNNCEIKIFKTFLRRGFKICLEIASI